MQKLYYSYGDFVQVNSNITDKTAGEVESVLYANNASVKVLSQELVEITIFESIILCPIWVDTTLAPEQEI